MSAFVRPPHHTPSGVSHLFTTLEAAPGPATPRPTGGTCRLRPGSSAPKSPNGPFIAFSKLSKCQPTERLRRPMPQPTAQENHFCTIYSGQYPSRQQLFEISSARISFIAACLFRKPQSYFRTLISPLRQSRLFTASPFHLSAPPNIDNHFFHNAGPQFHVGVFF